jgi:protein-tyrosine phosphatase
MDRARRIELEGALNFRDLGGYPTHDGQVVAWGRLFRSDGLHQLTAADLDVIHGLGIKVVCDLRNTNEVSVDVSRFPADERVRRLHLPIGGDAANAPSIIDLIRAGEIAAFGVDAVIDVYGMMIEHGAASFGTVVRQAADADQLPLLFHCTAGKDRTGVTAMLLLSVLGVADDDILDDYALTTDYRSGARVEQLRPELEAAGVDVEAVLPFLVAPREVMAGAMAFVRDRWGSIEAYLTGPAGVPVDAVPRLRELHLEDAAAAGKP